MILTPARTTTRFAGATASSSQIIAPSQTANGSLIKPAQIARDILNVWMATSEIPPLRTTGGLADAVHGLSEALVHAGHHVSIFVPHHTGTLEMAIENIHKKYPNEPIHIVPLPRFSISFGEYTETVRITTLEIPFSSKDRTGLKYYFVDNVTDEAKRNMFGNRLKVYGYNNDAYRFMFFNRVIAEFYRRTQANPQEAAQHFRPPHVIHSHDWGTGYIPYFLRHFHGNLPKVPLVYNIHNLNYSTPISSDAFYKLTGEVNPWVYSPAGLEFFHNIDPHKAAMHFADRSIVVSPKYLSEVLSGNVQAPAHLYQGIINHLGERFVGILNGIPDGFGPTHFYEEEAIPEDYGPDNLEGRIAARQLLLKVAKLDSNGNMIFVSSGRWSHQKGTDVLLDLLPTLLQDNQHLQFVTVGSQNEGEKRDFNAGFQALKNQFPGRVAVISFTSIPDKDKPHLSGENMEALAMAGGDAYIMPSRFEPCGLGQMKALNLGLPTIATATGGLANTIDHMVNGILFDHPSKENLRDAIMAAQRIYYDDPQKWMEMRIAGLQADFSWSRAAQHYVDVYQTIIDYWSKIPPYLNFPPFLIEDD